ncbi:MAG: PBSX family phage terminase large subunit [Oscillospiraceae bacterium]|nr:PBSX family phage terminase large subunit [Oscillospiraceae bacterium]
MSFSFSEFSSKQLKLLSWWAVPEISAKYRCIICDGAVRSGKTLVMSLSFMLWAMNSFKNQSFAICSKTIKNAERNIVEPLLCINSLKKRYGVKYSSSTETLTVTAPDGSSNIFYLFGGKDKTSFSYIQGITLAGVMLDETALMPKNFVDQAVARCSVSGSKIWFNCNPDSPEHWFFNDWILKAEEKKALLLHFLMSDNPSLSAETLENYEKLYSGVFYSRYILGEWTRAEGLVYPMFKKSVNTLPESLLPSSGGKFYISIDYGTVNPCSMGLWLLIDGQAFRIDEFYHDSRRSGFQLTDDEYYERLVDLAGDRPISCVIIDPSAASFIARIRKSGKFKVRGASNDVLNGIRLVSALLSSGRIVIGENCKDCIREFSAYSWSDDLSGDTVIKEFDHAMDDLRYFVYSVMRR